MSKALLKTRFCPSPTGLVHLGNIRTALFNVLFAKKNKGIFLLRIEDTDKLRSDEKYTEALMQDLRWLHLNWNEGPVVGGDAAPYWQSQRQDIYDQDYHELEEKGFAYPCFCTEQQLAIARKIQRASGKPPRYPGTCRNLSKSDIEKKLAEGLLPTLRFRVPDNQTIEFTDLVRGPQKFQSNDLGDFIIRRTDGTSPFMYCNAIDDALMGVTHVLRGEDHLTNTPRQLMILRALNLHEPQYGHISMIVGPDGSPLSKRHGSRNIQELRAEGYLPDAINNYLARLGHYYADESFMSLEQLAEKFSTDTLGNAPARFDPQQLLRWQKEAVLRLTQEQLWDWLGEDLKLQIPITQQELFLNTVKPNIIFPEDAQKWFNVFFSTDFIYSNESLQIIKDAGKEFFNVAIQAFDQHGVNFSEITNAIKFTLNVKGMQLFQPLRVAFTNEKHGPEMVNVLLLLGAEKVKQRLQLALAVV